MTPTTPSQPAHPRVSDEQVEAIRDEPETRYEQALACDLRDLRAASKAQAEEIERLAAFLAERDAKLAATEAELKAAREAQPVETAPKDGTWLLLALHTRYPNDAPMEVGHWGTYETVDGREFTGWWVGGCEYRDAEIESWLPLPSALTPSTTKEP